MILEYPVRYLQLSDFDSNGNLINPSIPRNKPIIVMVQADFCGYCTQAKPAYQEFANKHSDKVFVATIQGDGKRQGEPELSQLLRSGKVAPNFNGFPSYFAIVNGQKVAHNGGRSLEELEAFVNTL
jgi:thiol-disulfide isomerase/thioredoxin